MQHVTKDGSSCICMKYEKASLWCDTRDMKVAPLSVTWMSGYDGAFNVPFEWSWTFFKTHE